MNEFRVITRSIRSHTVLMEPTKDDIFIAIDLTSFLMDLDILSINDYDNFSEREWIASFKKDSVYADNT